MTQLMLFDAPASSAAPVASVPSERTASPQAVESPCSHPTTPEPVEGVQRMGDLARFVLLRYQLVAQRRAAQAARAATRLS